VAVPDGLLIAGAVVGLVGGVIGATSGGVNLIVQAVRAARAKRDAQVVLRMDFHEYYSHQGEDGHQYPIATAHLVNHGKVPAKDVEVTSSTGYVALDAEGRTIAPDKSGLITFAMSPVHMVERGASTAWWPDSVPTEMGPVTLTVTWRIDDGTSRRSEPKEFTHAYRNGAFG
jgi:hypothetical protein